MECRSRSRRQRANRPIQQSTAVVQACPVTVPLRGQCATASVGAAGATSRPFQRAVPDGPRVPIQWPWPAAMCGSICQLVGCCIQRDPARARTVTAAALPRAPIHPSRTLCRLWWNLPAPLNLARAPRPTPRPCIKASTCRLSCVRQELVGAHRHPLIHTIHARTRPRTLRAERTSYSATGCA